MNVKKRVRIQNVIPSVRQVEPTSARVQGGPGATPPPRSRPAPAPQTGAPIAAAGLTEIVPTLSDQAGAEDFFKAEAGAGDKGAGLGTGAEGDGDGVEALLTEREATHGQFVKVAFLARRLQDDLCHGANYALGTLDPEVHLAMDQICLKLARIACGDQHFADHWLDIEGYARLAREA